MTNRWLVVFTDGRKTEFDTSSYEGFLDKLAEMRVLWGEIRCVLRLT